MDREKISAELAEVYRQIQEHLEHVGNFAALSSHKTMYMVNIEKSIRKTLAEKLNLLAEEYGVEIVEDALEIIIDKDQSIAKVNIPYNLVQMGQDIDLVSPFLVALQNIFGISIQYPATQIVERKLITLEVK